MVSEENERLVRDFYESGCRWDPEEMAEYFTDDCAYEDRTIALDAHGRAEVRSFFERLIKDAGPGFRFQFQMCNITSQGGLVFTERYDRVHRASGSLEYQVASVLEIESGKIRRGREYWDRRTSLNLAPGVEPVSRPIPPRHVDTGPITADAERVVLDFMEAASRLDVEELVAFCAEDAIYEDRPSGYYQRGHRELRTLFEAFRSRLLSIFGVQPVNWAADGNLVFVERIDHFDLPSGHVAVPVLSVAELEGGKIKHMREYWDTATSGLPEPPRTPPA